MAKLVGASVWEQSLYEHLTSHEQNERALLVQYQEIASSSQSKAFRYLSGLIIEDEIRHHRIFGELASALKNESELGGGDPVIPRLERLGSDSAQVLELSEQLLEQERTDANELRHLASELEHVGEGAMWPLLVRIMEIDTAKHIEILEFVKRYAEKSRD